MRLALVICAVACVALGLWRGLLGQYDLMFLGVGGGLIAAVLSCVLDR
jgi:uncharacterized membrane protein